MGQSPIWRTSGLSPQTTLLHHINDIDLATTLIKILSEFADDTKMANRILTDKNREELQECINEMVKWSEKSCMEYNVQKCKVLHELGKNLCFCKCGFGPGWIHIEWHP